MNIQNTEIMQKQYILYRKKRFLAIVIALIMISMAFSGCRFENVNALTEEVEMTTTPEDTSQDREFDTEQTAEPSQTPQPTNEQENTPAATDEITETQESSQEPEETTAVIEETLSPETTEEITALTSEETTTEADVTPSPIPEPTSTTEPEATPSPEMTEQSTVELTEEAEATPEPTEEVPDATCSGADTNEYTIVSFIYEAMSYVVERGVPEEDLPLPETLSAVNGNGETITVPVTWENEVRDVDVYESEFSRYEAERLSGYGPWTFTAIIDEEYIYEGEEVIATVSIPECYVLENFCGIESGSLLMRFLVIEGDEVNLPNELLGCMEDGGYKAVPVTWSGSYDTNTAGKYTLTMSLNEGYSGFYATVEIVVKKETQK